MELEELWAEIEADHTGRVDEIRFFQNQSTFIDNEQAQDQFRRAIILLLYAHFEGFCKFSFNLYVNSINKLAIKCNEANYAIVAASLSDIFKSLRNPDKKCKEFKRELPDDNQLHRFARDREFIEFSSNFGEQIVKIPEDLVDTESNLKPIVLRKNLYKLGFPHDLFEDIEGLIHQLLNYRNKIAHGELKEGISLNQYEELRQAAYKVMDEVKKRIMQALTDKVFLRELNSSVLA